MSEFDALAEHCDKSRGGDQGGDDYAAHIDARLPPGDGLILDIGVGTGVAALGFRRRGRRVLGLDLSFPMLSRAGGRLGPVVVCSDAMATSVATAIVAHAGIGVGRALDSEPRSALPRGSSGASTSRAICGVRLDEEAIEEVTRPAIEALRDLPRPKLYAGRWPRWSFSSVREARLRPGVIGCRPPGRR